MRRLMIGLAAGVLSAVTLGAPAVAQYDNLEPVRPNGTATAFRDVDEPGRNPYQETELFNQTSAVCPNTFYCRIVFSPVPTGKRLVVTYAGAYFGVSSGTAAETVLGKSTSQVALMIDVPTRTTDNGRFIAAGPVTAYFEAGESPTLYISANSIQTGNSGHAALSGYFVKAN